MLAAGPPILLPVEHGVHEGTVRDPGGATHRARDHAGRLSFTETDQVGLYTLTTGGSGKCGSRSTCWTATSRTSGPQPLPVAPPPTAGEAATASPTSASCGRSSLGLAMLTLALEGFLYWRRQTAGRLSWPSRASDRWALASRGVALGAARLGAHPAHVPPLGGPAERRLPAGHVRQRQPRRARDARTGWPRRRSGGMKAGDRAGLIVFGEEAQVAEPLRPTPTFDRPQAPVGGRGTNLAQAIQLALASLPPGQANRIVLLTDGRQNAGNAVVAAQAAKDAGTRSTTSPVAADVPAGGRRRADGAAAGGQVRRAVPGQGGGVELGQGDAGGRLSLYRNGEFLGSQVVRLNAGKNVFTYRQSLEQRGIHVYQALRRGRRRHHRGEQPRGRASPWCAASPRCCWPTRSEAQAQTLAAALRSQNIDVTVVGAGGHPQGLAGAAEVRRRRSCPTCPRSR